MCSRTWSWMENQNGKEYDWNFVLFFMHFLKGFDIYIYISCSWALAFTFLVSNRWESGAERNGGCSKIEWRMRKDHISKRRGKTRSSLQLIKWFTNNDFFFFFILFFLFYYRKGKRIEIAFSVAKLEHDPLVYWSYHIDSKMLTWCESNELVGVSELGKQVRPMVLGRVEWGIWVGWPIGSIKSIGPSGWLN